MNYDVFDDISGYDIDYFFNFSFKVGAENLALGTEAKQDRLLMALH